MLNANSLNGEAGLSLHRDGVESRRERNHKERKLRKIHEQIRMGFGQGHGIDYQPWLQIRRKSSTSKSNQVAAWMEPLGRVAHYFSKGEYKTALLLLWLGADDLREQYPLWPVSHPHPLEGAHGSVSTGRPWVRGLVDIASDAGINHGVEVGTSIPYVATIDQLATIRSGQGVQLVGISCKPIKSVAVEIRHRTLERFELERRYFDEIGGRYWVAHSGLVPNLMAGQLELWMNDSTLHNSMELHQYSDRLAQIFSENGRCSIAECVSVASTRLGIHPEDVWVLFRYCAWHQLIDIDPSVRVVTSYPVQRGGRALKIRLRKAIFGEV